LRHTFASTLAESGTNLYTIQKLLMQKSPQMTKRYAHLRDESLRKAAETAGRALAGPVGRIRKILE
jgi:site-specific recombinase XerD